MTEDEMQAFSDAIVEAGYLAPTRNQRGDGWLYERDHDRFVGWQIARCEVNDSRQNAVRYEWLRAQHWNSGLLAVVADPKSAIKLGYDCPSLDRLDDAIDAAMMAEKAIGAA